jgi:hypothetical protein
MKVPPWLKILVLVVIVAAEWIWYRHSHSDIQVLLNFILPPDPSSLDAALLQKLLLGSVCLANTWLGYWLVRGIYSLHMLPNRLYIENLLARSERWLLSATTHWGLTLKASAPRVANTAEGLIALAGSGKQLSPSALVVVDSAVNYLVEAASIRGLPSISLGERTVHCTAMGLLALLRLGNGNRLKNADKLAQTTRDLTTALWQARSRLGWGFKMTPTANSDDVRVFSTLWALRALNMTPMCAQQEYGDIFKSIANAQTELRHGFTMTDAPKTSMVAFFVIVVNELSDRDLKKEMFKRIEDAHVREFLLGRFAGNTFSESEEYLANMPQVEKLSTTDSKSCQSGGKSAT